MAATITDLAEFRAWKQAKEAWRASNPHPSQAWELLSEEERLAYRRAFELASSRLRRGRW